MNPFFSIPEAAQFWREQQQACEEARRLLVKTPEFGQFLAAGGKIDVVPDWLPANKTFYALFKDGDSVLAATMFVLNHVGDARCQTVDLIKIRQLTAWLAEARDGAKQNDPIWTLY